MLDQHVVIVVCNALDVYEGSTLQVHSLTFILLLEDVFCSNGCTKAGAGVACNQLSSESVTFTRKMQSANQFNAAVIELGFRRRIGICRFLQKPRCFQNMKGKKL